MEQVFEVGERDARKIKKLLDSSASNIGLAFNAVVREVLKNGGIDNAVPPFELVMEVQTGRVKITYHCE